MATRYWVGGSGAWSSGNTANWSTSSGGAGGASVPLITDDVVFDGNSGVSAIITLDSSTSCTDFNTSGFNGTIIGGATPNLVVRGDVTLSSTTLIAESVDLLFGTFASNATQNFNSGSATLQCLVSIGGFSTTSLQSNLVLDYFRASSGNVFNIEVAGNLALNSHTLSAYNGNISSGSFDFGSGKIVHSGPGRLGASPDIFNIDCNSTTISGSNRLIEVTTPFSGYSKSSSLVGEPGISDSGITTRLVANVSSGGSFELGFLNNFDANNQNVIFIGTSSTRIYGNFRLGGANPQWNPTFKDARFFTGAGQTVLSKTITCNGGSFADVYFGDGTNSPNTYTLVDNFNCTGTFSFADFGTPASGSISLNLNGKTLNCGTFTTAGSDTRTLTFGTNGKIKANNFNTSSTSNLTLVGTPLVEIKTPLTGTTNTFTSGLFTTFVVSVVQESIGGTVSINGTTQNLTFANAIYNAAGTVTVLGDLVVSGSLPTFTSGTYTLAKSSGTQIINTNGATFNNTVNLNSASTTFRFDSAFTMGTTGTLTLTTGTASFNGQTITIGILSSSNLNARTLAFGDSTVNVIGSGTAWNCATSTNLTITYGGAGRISMNSASAKTFAGGSKTWPTVNQGGAGTLTVTGSNTFTNFTNTVTGCTIAFPSGTTIFTNFNVRGVPGSLVTMSSTSTLFKASGLVAVNYLNLSNSTATGGARWYAGAGSTNGGGNTGWLFVTASSGGFLAFF